MLLALLLSAQIFYPQTPAEAAAKRLASVQTFAFGGVGFAAATSQGEVDFRLVLSQSAPVALAAFDNLFASGNPQAKAYALAGIKKLDPARFRELLATVTGLTGEVQTTRGCVGSHESLQAIAQQIESGDLDSDGRLWVPKPSRQQKTQKAGRGGGI